MPDADRDIYRTNPASLANIMHQVEGPWHDWQPQELDQMLLQQMQAMIDFDPQFLSGELARKLTALSARGRPLPNRFCDLFRHPSPPLEVLEYVKRMAKANRGGSDSPMQKIATVLYYASILVALMRCGQRITQLDDDELRHGTQWVLEQTWIDPATRKLFEEAASYLEASR